MASQFPSKVSILNAMQNQVCYRAPVLQAGSIIKKGSRVIYFTGGFSIVFQFEDRQTHKITAVRCWCAEIDNAKQRTQIIEPYLNQLNSQYFAEFKYVEEALYVDDEDCPGVIPIVTMDWVDGMLLKDYIEENIPSRNKLLELAEKFLEMVRFFHNNNIAHGDLQHGNIKIRNEGGLAVVDYDSMFVAGLDGMVDIIKGYGGYQHPARQKNRFIHKKLDYFSEMVIYLSLLVYADPAYDMSNPLIWNYDTDYLLFSKEDFEAPYTSEIFKLLRNSSNSKISNLTFKLIDSLKHVDISQLLPLEEMLDDKMDKIANSIIVKF